MANRGGISVSNSRFACLAIDDDDQEDKKAQAKSNPPPSASSSKKRNKKKKEHKENEQLKSLAFGLGKPGSTRGKQTSGGGGGDRKVKGDEKDWDQWQQHDTQSMDKQYKDDIAQALLESKIDIEKKEQEAKEQQRKIEAGIEFPNTKEGRKKKKQREKPQPMSLEQFKQLPKEKPVGDSDDSDHEMNGTDRHPPIQSRVPPTEQDPTFFNSVEDEAQHIIRHEKVQENYRKQYMTDNAVIAKFRDDLEKKDQRIAELSGQVETLESELKQVKKRNKQLCFILAQGEMKDKAQVLLQVEDLTKVKDELTDQVTSLTADLEKEKSKNHSLKAEIDKLKASRHGK